jgi:hypothetical protein
LFLQFAKMRFETFCHISETIGPIDLSVNVLCSADTLRRTHCCFFNLQKWGFKHFVISQKLLGQSAWGSTSCA